MTITLPLAAACHLRGHAWITSTDEDAEPSDAIICGRCATSQPRSAYTPRHLRPSGANRAEGIAPVSPA